MGTQATACLYDILHNLQCVVLEQEYIDVLLYSKPSIPDRTAYITGQSTVSPLEALVNAAKILENAGVDCIAIPCATSHYFYNDLVKAVSIPILNLLDETAKYLNTLGAKKVILFATNGTIKSRLFHNAFEKRGIEAVTPPDSIQADLMEIIYDIKRGEAVSLDVLSDIVSKVCDDGVDAVVLGCTELCVLGAGQGDDPLVLGTSRQGDRPPVFLINILEVLAEASIAFCKDGKSKHNKKIRRYQQY
jgi:aspartate racemase